MLAFTSFNNSGTGIDPSNYDVETGGYFLAIQEAYADLADIDAMCADYNSIVVGYAAEGLQDGGRHGMESAMESFQLSPISEGFFGSLKDKIVKALKALKEKIIAFFKSVIQFLSRLFLSDKEFVKKYKNELEAVDPDGMKFEMYDYSKFGDVVNSICRAADGVTKDNIEKLSLKHGSTNKMNETIVEFLSSGLSSIGVSNTPKQSRLLEDIQRALRGGNKNKKEVSINSSMIHHMIDAVTDDKIIEGIDTMRDKVVGEIDNAISHAEKEQAAHESYFDDRWNTFIDNIVNEAVEKYPDGSYVVKGHQSVKALNFKSSEYEVAVATDKVLAAIRQQHNSHDFGQFIKGRKYRKFVELIVSKRVPEEKVLSALKEPLGSDTPEAVYKDLTGVKESDSVALWNDFYNGVVMEKFKIGQSSDYKWHIYDTDGNMVFNNVYSEDKEKIRIIANLLSKKQNPTNQDANSIYLRIASNSGISGEDELAKKQGTPMGQRNYDRHHTKDTANTYRAFAVGFSNAISAIVTKIKDTHKERSSAYASCLSAALRYKKVD